MKNLICFLMLAACIALFASCGAPTDTSLKAQTNGFTFEIEYEYEENENPDQIEIAEKYKVRLNGVELKENPMPIPPEASEMNIKIYKWNPTCIWVGTKQYCF